ncbi:MAG: glycosyltransferase family 4 protein [Armatimonadota bacterium]
MNILHTEASTGWGGQEIRILTESEGMIARGHRVMLACQPGSVISKRAADYGVETFVFKIGGAFDIPGIRRLADLVRDERVDIVNTHSSKDSWAAGLAMKMFGAAKLVRTRHLSIPIKSGFESRLLYRGIPDAVVTTGETLRRHVIEQVEIDPELVVSIPTGLDLSRFSPGAADGKAFREELGVGNAPLIGTVGMLRRMKGHEHFLAAAGEILARVPEAKFVIVGDVAFASSIKSVLAEQMAELGITEKVFMPGYRNDIPEVMAALDVFVLASTEHEGVPQVVSQALAMERPVVATDVGSTSELVKDGETGLLIPPADPKAIAQAVLSLLEDRENAKRMARAGRKLAEEKLSIEAMLDATEALYEKLLS